MSINQANPPLLAVNDLTVKISELTLADKVSFTIKEKERLLIVGPNGAGKSTIINGISQSLQYTGEILFKGKDIAKMDKKEIARSIGVLAQYHVVNYAFTVEEIVELGRYAYRSNWITKNGEDKDFVQEALEMTGLIEKRKQSVLTLSGGEIQRTFLAQLFAQNPQLLILDEPTNHLDIQYQQQIFELIEQWVQRKNKAVLAVIHDLSLASYFGNCFLLMNEGNMMAYGTKEEVLIPELLNRVYGMNVEKWMQNLYKYWGKYIH